MNSLSSSVPVHLSVMTCTAKRQLLLETAENRNFVTDSERNFHCPRSGPTWSMLVALKFFSVWRAFELT